ncbi:MAG: hypothetical protein ACKVJN_10100, partial [Woeseiales bacterium]
MRWTTKHPVESGSRRVALIAVSHCFLAHCFLALCLLATISVEHAFAQPTPIQLAPAFSGDELYALPTNNWPTHGGNLANQRYSPLNQITRENIGDLKAVWRTHLDGSGAGARYSGEASPIVYDGVIYIPTGEN